MYSLCSRNRPIGKGSFRTDLLFIQHRRGKKRCILDKYSGGLVSIIIPAWNGRQDLPACLCALEQQTGVDVEVIVVDNGSEDGSADYVAARHPHVHLLRNTVNLGFSVACNMGLHQANGSVFVLLNQDTVVRPNWLVSLVEPFRHDETVGIAGSKMQAPDCASG